MAAIAGRSGRVMLRLQVAIEYDCCIAKAVVCSAHVGVEVMSVGRSCKHVVVV